MGGKDGSLDSIQRTGGKDGLEGVLAAAPAEKAAVGGGSALWPYPPDVDIFRNTPVRYLGYTNELGESFKAFLSKAVYRTTYAVSVAYALGDAVDKGFKSFEKASAAALSGGARDAGAGGEANGPEDPSVLAAKEVMDVFVWQALASVIFPGFAVNRAVWAAGAGLGALVLRGVAVPHLARTYGPTGVGLAAIPFIINPIDHFTDDLLDATMRPLLHRQGHQGDSWGND